MDWSPGVLFHRIALPGNSSIPATHPFNQSLAHACTPARVGAHTTRHTQLSHVTAASRSSELGSTELLGELLELLGSTSSTEY